jgi:hypothetical protein
MMTMAPPPDGHHHDTLAFHSLHTMLSQLSFSTEIPTEEADKQPYNFFQGGLFCLSFDNEDYYYDAMEDCDGYDENGHCIDDDHHNHTLYGLRDGAQHNDDPYQICVPAVRLVPVVVLPAPNVAATLALLTAITITMPTTTTTTTTRTCHPTCTHKKNLSINSHKMS